MMYQGLKMLSMGDLQRSMIEEMNANNGKMIFNKETGSAYTYALKQGIVILNYNLPNKSSACAVRPLCRDGVEKAKKIELSHLKKGMIAVEW